MVSRVICILLLAPGLWLLPVAPTMAQGDLPSDPTQPFIEVELEPKTVYVQSMVRYHIRLYRNSHLQRGYFLDRDIPDTVMELSHDTPPRYVERNGREYELLERHYLLFPQRSGTIKLPPAVFSSRDLFVQGTAATLEVKPRPDSGNWAWLPAMDLQLHDRLELPEGDIHRGMQLRRTITIKANGLTGAQLPGIAIPTIDGVVIQDLGSEVQQQIIGGVMTGQRKIQQLIIPNRGGSFTLPEISIDWWNSNSNSPQTATLPIIQLKVTDDPEAPTELAVTDRKSATDGVEQPVSKPLPEPATDTNLSLLALLLSLIAYGLLIWHYRLFSKLRWQHQVYACIRRFKVACRENDATAAVTALLTWGYIILGDDAPASVLGFRKLFADCGSQAALLELDQARYTANSRDWSGTAALGSVVPLMKNRIQNKNRKKTGCLPTLYGK